MIDATAIKASPVDPPQSARSVFELKAGEAATVCRVQAYDGSPLNEVSLARLGELGFLAGESVTLLRRGPGGREPLAVQIGDTVFALRAVEARCILIED